MSRRFYQNFVPQQAITGALSSGATAVTVASFTSWPTSFPFFAVLDYGLASSEIVSVTGIIGNTATITRGQGGSVAQAHTAGATFDFAFTAQDFDEANAHVNSTSGVHGASGSVVGTSDTQTLSNKTFTGTTTFATLTATTLTVTGTSSIAGLTASGNISALNLTATAAVTAASATLGTLSVTGSAGVSGNVSITGTLTVNSTANLSGNAGVGGTLTVTGGASVASLSTVGIGAVTGNLRGTQYANEAAADTAGVVAGSIVYLTAPTNNGNPASNFVKLGTNNYAPLGADTGWITPTLTNSWVSFDGGATYDIPQYKQKDGIVWVKGMAKSGTVALPIFTLPAGFRPGHKKKVTCPASTGVAELNIGTDGTVLVAGYYAGGTNAYVSLEFSFQAEA